MNNPYGHHPYPPGYGYQQPQRYPPQPGQLPPMQTTMGAPPMPMGPVPNSAMSGPPMSGPHGYASRDYAPPPPAFHGVQRPQQLPQPAPTQPREPAALSHSAVNGQYKYTLVVEQQPLRARMCGFGDKDRRPITPPPCIRLIISDATTGKEVDCEGEDFDGTFFVLQVDLWDENGQREVNLVRASNNSPAVSISTATMTSYPPTPERPMMHEMGHPGMQYPANGHPFPQPQYGGAYPFAYGQPGYPPAPVQYVSNMAPASNMMFTRNLIGSLTVNASKLQDTSGKSGFWFVLQDLSVRTEGFFRYATLIARFPCVVCSDRQPRLKMNFIDVGNGPIRTATGLNKGRAPVLAWVYSDKFQVYSAKKFPGVIESTSLSKCFAGQGIKIPIRKDVKSEGKDEEDD
ncbi:hypothetical protein LTR08_007968 [Meristemomyces frigidus]|nr:hypothetical protein LTR08_007968 [Meristemomyces frigidus]